MKGIDLDGYLDSGTSFQFIRSVSQIAAACSVLFLPVGYEVLYVWAHCTEFVSKKNVSCCFPSTGPVGVGRSDLKPMQNAKLIIFGLFVH